MLDKMYPGYKIVEKVIYLQRGPGRLKPDTNNFTGDLYVLVNGLTFSATTGFLAQLQEQNIGIYVGETPGGAYRGLNAGPPVVVTLPNSGLRLFFRPICTEYKVTQARDRLDIDFEIEWTNGYFDLDFEDEVKKINSLLKN